MYNKIFTKILDSSIWMEPNATRIVWITFLAAMDEDGFAAFASVKNVAHRACVSIEDAEKALAFLESPDKDSGDPDNDGRRLERTDGGWIVLNARKYRSVATREHQRAQTRERVRRHRERSNVTHGNADVTHGNDLVTPSEAEAEANAEDLEAADPSGSGAPPQKSQKSKPKPTDAEWIASLKADAAYQGIDVDREHAKMIRWCETNRKPPTRRRFVAWLNRIDPPMNAQKGEFADAF